MTSRFIKSNRQPTLPCFLNHTLRCHTYTSFKYLHRWRLHHLSGQPVPVPDHSFSEEILPNIQPKPPLTQLEAASSCSITTDLGEETNTHLAATSFQVVVESNKVSPYCLLFSRLNNPSSLNLSS